MVLGAQARGRPPESEAGAALEHAEVLQESLRATVESRGASIAFEPVSLDDVPGDTWDNGVSIRLYSGLDEVQDFAVFGCAKGASGMVRWLFGYGADELISGARLKDGLGETLNQVVGRIKNGLHASGGFVPRLDTPEILERTASEMYGRVHAEFAAFAVTSDAWSGRVIFMSSPRRQHAIAALEQATSLLLRFGVDRDAMARACRLLEEVRAPMLALAELPAMGITLSWCIEHLAVLVNGVEGYREKALFHRVVRELDSLQTALARLTAPAEATAFKIPVEADLRVLLGDFCDEVGRSIEDAEEALSANGDDLAHRLFRTMHAVRGNAAFFGLEQVQRVARGTQNLLGSVRDSGGRLSDQQLEAVRHSLYLIEDWVDSLAEALDGGDSVDWSVDLEAHGRMLEHFLECGGRIAIPRPGGSAAGVNGDLSEHLRLDEAQVRRLEAIRADVKRWVDLAVNDGDGSNLEEQREFLQRTHSQLSVICQSVRRVPLSNLLGNLARHAREGAQRHGKLVRVDVSGDNLAAPEHLVAALSGPLVHLVNNAIEHGVEGSVQRQAAGKKVLASLEIRAAHGEGVFTFEVVDDGGGIPRREVLDAAREAGLVEGDGSTADALDLVFHPRVSTWGDEPVLDKGMGLDVVKREVDALNGQVEVTSTPGAGTRVRLTLPECAEVLEDDVEAVEEEAPIEELESDGELNFL